MKKIIISIFSIFLIIYCFTFVSFAEENDDAKSFLIISHHFECSDNAEDYLSTESIASDFEIGADMVAVSFIPEWIRYTGREITIEELLDIIASIVEIIPDGKAIILDNAWEYRDEIDKLAESLNADDKIILRTTESTKKIQNESISLRTVSIYSGGIVFSADERVRFSKPNGILQFQSKNYFNPFYQKLFTKHFTSDVPVITPMYDKNLCGQRTDSAVGWDEMIVRGYTAIETANVSGLVDYRDQINVQSDILKSVLAEEKEVLSLQSGLYSTASVKKLSDAVKKGENSLKELSSLSELQTCCAEIRLAHDKLALSYGEDTTLGAWNITAGKVVASVLCGMGLIGIELFMIKHKKRRENEQNSN